MVYGYGFSAFGWPTKMSEDASLASGNLNITDFSSAQIHQEDVRCISAEQGIHPMMYWQTKKDQL